MNSIIKLVLSTVFSLIFFSCSDNSPVAGGGGLDTESSGGILVGQVQFSNGDPGRNTLIKLLPLNYSIFSQCSIRTILTNESGEYRFEDVDTGLYNLEAVSIDSGSRLLHPALRIIKDSVTNIDHDTLKAPGSILINIQNNPGAGYLYIPGTTISERLTAADSMILIDSVPVAASLSLFFRKDSQSNASVLVDNIIIRSADTTSVTVYSNIDNSQKIFLNTSNSGAYTQSDLFGVPVLLRFTSSNFDFDLLQIDKDQISLTKPDGTPLSFEVERWDTLNRNGEIWVNLDTLYGNSTSQYLLMQPGDTDAVDNSSHTVFDTANGFIGVWHIFGEKSGIRNHQLYKDATTIQNHGDDYIHARGIAGVTGSGKQFNGEDDYIKINDNINYHFDSEPFTLSMWFNKVDTGKGTLFVFKFDTTEKAELGILSDSNSNIILYAQHGPSVDTICKHHVQSLNQWHYLNVIRKESDIFELYIDGEQVDQSIFSLVLSSSANGEGIFIGANVNNEEPFDPFNGFIDEVRIESEARNPEFVRFNYLNQKPGTLLTSK